MIDIPPPDRHTAEAYPFLDELLRDALPEIKLALGELIDRENSRPLPPRYARLLPDSLLAVTLRPDAAEAMAPVAREIERELTDSCSRHGSLYDRRYRVQLRRAEDPEAPLYRVAAHAGHEVAEPVEEEMAEPVAERTRPDLPEADPDTTRWDEAPPGDPDWESGRWVLVVENEQGEEEEVFRISDRYTTIGRQADDPRLRTAIALRGVPHVSRRQLVLVWAPRDGAPGFDLYNVGLPPVYLATEELEGAHVGRGTLQLESLPKASVGWIPPGVPLRIGDRGPLLRVEEVPTPAQDPDATVYE